MQPSQHLIDILASTGFMTLVHEQQLPPRLHNDLLAAHLLAIGFVTTGISEGSISVRYSQNLAPYEECLRPEFAFAFYTTRNALIEPGLRCSNVSQRLHNPLVFCSTTRSWRNWCREYLSKNCFTLDLSCRGEAQQPSGGPLGSFALQGQQRTSLFAKDKALSTILSETSLAQAVQALILHKTLAANLPDVQARCKKMKI